MRQTLYPYLGEEVSGVSFDPGALLAFLLFMFVVIFQGGMLIAPITSLLNGGGGPPVVRGEAPEPDIVVGGGIVMTPTPVIVQVEVVTPTLVQPAPWELEATQAAVAMATATPVVVQPAQLTGYEQQRIIGRFSNYWPPAGGLNCFTDCEHFFDGGRVDQAIAEGQLVVACPHELLIGSRIEWPPDSGLIWTCRDRGEAITYYVSEGGVPIWWFDFLMPDPAVDWGSYIQVDLFVPVQ